MPTHPYAYVIPWQKRAGGGPLVTGTQFNVFATDVSPENPDNNQYLPVINGSTYPSIVVANKKLPRVSVHTCLKPNNGAGAGWSNAAFFNSLLGVDATNNTDDFAFSFKDEVDTRVYDYFKCERCDMAQNASGGPVAVMMGFKGRWGDTEAPYGTTLESGEVIPSAPAFTYSAQVPDAGQATPSSKVSIVGLTKVKGFQLTFLRGQAAQFFYNGDNHPAEIVSTMFSGVATFDQEPDADTFITDTGTVTIKFNTDLTSTTGRFKITLLLKRDNRFKPVVTTLGNITSTYSMFDQTSGGNPAAFVAY